MHPGGGAFRRGATADDERLATIFRAVERLRTAGVKVVAFAPPLAPTVIDALDNVHANPRFPLEHPKLAAMSACLESLQSELGRTATKRLLRDVEPAQCLGSEPADASKTK